MPTETLIRCACCAEHVAQSESFYDDDLRGMVCGDCRTQLRWAQGWLGNGFVRMGPDQGGGILPVNIRGCYQGWDAGDNQRPMAA
jgi:hypothetical protein